MEGDPQLKAKDGHLRERNGRASAKNKEQKNKEQVRFCDVNTETQRSERSMEQIILQGREQGITHHAWWILTSNPACTKNEPKQSADLCKASVFLSEK